MCFARKWKEPVNDLETYQMMAARPVSSDIWCCGLVMLFCQNLEWNWNLLPCHCNEHCISHLKNFQQRPISTSICVLCDQLSLHLLQENEVPNSLNGNKSNVDIDIRGFLNLMVAMNYRVHVQASADIDDCCLPTWQRPSQRFPILCLQSSYYQRWKCLLWLN